MNHKINALIGSICFLFNHPFNKYSGRFSAFARYISWQAECFLRDGFRSFSFVEDSMLLCRRGMTGATGNLYCGLHEHIEMSFVLHYLREGDYFVDVGANVGSYSILAASGPKSNVIAFEPIKSTYEVLLSNSALNGLLDKITVKNMGLSREAGVLRFTSSGDTVNRVLLSSEVNSSDTVFVNVSTVDAELEAINPSVLKIDVEGHEMSVLEGAHNILSNPTLNAVIMEVNGSGDKFGVSDLDLFRKMAEYGFSTYSYDPFKRSLIPLTSRFSGNVIFIRNVDDVASRLSSSRRYRIANRFDI